MNRVMIPFERRKLDIQAKKGWYEITNRGDVIKCYKNGKEFPLTKFYGNGSRKSGCLKLGSDRKCFSVARIVWETFRGKIPDGMIVAHRSLDKNNDALDNLYLTTYHESGKAYGMINGTCYGNQIRTVAKIDKKGNILQTWRSITEAAEANYMSRPSVTERCYKRMKNVWLPDGTTFVFEDEVI